MASDMCITGWAGEHWLQEATLHRHGPPSGAEIFVVHRISFLVRWISRSAPGSSGALVLMVRWDVEQVVVRPDGQFSHHR